MANFRGSLHSSDERVLMYHQSNSFIPVGIYLGDIEEGARIISFVRLFPKGHSKAEGHDFPTAKVFYIGEVEILLEMGKSLGWNLYATLYRLPDPPIKKWPYLDFEPPPNIKSSGFTIIERQTVPIPGLLSIACSQEEPLAYIFDTRNLTLEERNMERPTSSGIDISRDKLEMTLTIEYTSFYHRQLAIIVYN